MPGAWRKFGAWPRAIARLALLALYIPSIYAATLALGLFPRWRKPEARIGFARRFYFLTAVIAFGARMHIDDASEAELGARPRLYVCNHISWMDILTLYRAFPIRFISKHEVGAWPFIGHFARWAGTIFLVRGQGGGATIRRATEALGANSVVLFAEGTSTDGRQVRRFLPPAFRAAREARVPVVPVTLHYRCHGHDPSGKGVSYYGEESLIASVWRSAQLRGVDVHIRAHPPLDAAAMDASETAELAHRSVAEGLAELRQQYP